MKTLKKEGERNTKLKLQPKTLNCKGQIFTTDLILAVTVFLFVLTLTIIYSNQVANRVGYWEEANDRENAALWASSALVLSSGEPSNWENLALEDINSIGLAGSKSVLLPSKLQRLVDLNSGHYSEAKALLGLAKYGVRIEVSDLNKQLLNAFGLEPGSESQVSAFTRLAVLNGKPVLVKVEAFE